MKTLTFGDISLIDYGCWYDGSNYWNKPEKMVDTFSVPGRNGDLSVDTESYSNIERSFNCHINDNFPSNYKSLIDALHLKSGYQRFECSEDPDVYCMALFSSEINVSPGQLFKWGTFPLNFNFKPQKWLKLGENPILIVSSATLVNPTSMTALPKIEVVGTGSITIGTSVLTLATNTSTTIIDCEMEDAYEGTINRNGDLTITNGFPKLVSGNNTVTVSGFTSCKITPRWWRL